MPVLTGADINMYKDITGMTEGANRSIDRSKAPLLLVPIPGLEKMCRLHIRLLDADRFDNIPNALLYLLAILRASTAFHPAFPSEFRRRRPSPAADPRDNGRLRRLDTHRRAMVDPLLQLEKEGLIVRVVGLLAAVVVGLRADAVGVGLAVDDAVGGAARTAVAEGSEGGEADADDAGRDFGGAAGVLVARMGHKGVGWTYAQRRMLG